MKPPEDEETLNLLSGERIAGTLTLPAFGVAVLDRVVQAAPHPQQLVALAGRRRTLFGRSGTERRRSVPRPIADPRITGVPCPQTPTFLASPSP
ncbi:hypothetical protein [Deinococcus sp.]|uniref:hypothetical protein n=1 Tax=Deinococcus sp. TaxID=47478 RepID=UPI0028698161|nr:hypothetical protein [Deinococcus sp.]